MVTLEDLPSGARAKITKIVEAGESLLNRLYQMGIVPGEPVEVVVNYGFGPIIIRVQGVETAISRGIARKIFVERVD